MLNSTNFSVSIETDQSGVTGSSTLVTINYPLRSVRKFIVDCGYHPDLDVISKENMNFSYNPEEIDFAVATHAHIDHIGKFPNLYKEGYRGGIYMTRSTSKLAPEMLINSCQVQNERLKSLGKSPIITETHIRETTKLFKTVCYEETVCVEDGISLTMFKNAHIPGAAITLIQIEVPDVIKGILANMGKRTEYEPINLVFFGDYNVKNRFFERSTLPKWVRDLNVHVLMESTYGTTDSSAINETFEKNIIQAIEEKKKIIIPVCALNKMQDVLSRLKEIEKKIQNMPPVYVDGNLGLKISNIWNTLEEIEVEKRNFMPKNAKRVAGGARERDVILKTKNPIVVTTSGMMTYGPSMHYIPKALTNPNALIHITSYCAEGTLGRQILDSLDSESKVEYKGVEKKIICEVKVTNEMSSHGYRDVLVDALKEFKNLKVVMLHHGENAVTEDFAKYVKEHVDCKSAIHLKKGTRIRLSAFKTEKVVTVSENIKSLM